MAEERVQRRLRRSWQPMLSSIIRNKYRRTASCLQASGVFTVEVALGRSDQHDCGHTILLVLQRGRCTNLAALQ